MNKKALDVLEYKKIIELLKEEGRVRKCHVRLFPN